MTDKQKKFCDEYLVDCNATQAAIRAGYSEKTAYSIGEENLKKPEIKNYIDKHQKKEQERTKIRQKDIVTELKKIGFADIDPDSIKIKEKIAALELLAKILGLDKPEEEDSSGLIEELMDGFKKI